MNDFQCSVGTVRKIHAAFAERNLCMLDSPVSDGPSRAASGRMTIWFGGDEQILNRADAARQHGLRGIDRGDEPRLGHSQQHHRPTIAGRALRRRAARRGAQQAQAVLDADKPK
jgi:hypothetical protein